LQRLTAMRAYKRSRELGESIDPALVRASGLQPPQLERLYELLALAPYEKRYVIPKARRRSSTSVDEGCGREGRDANNTRCTCGRGAFDLAGGLPVA